MSDQKREATINMLQTAIRHAITELSVHYGDLPKEVYPGPPNSIITDLQTALKASTPATQED
jgi:hypothetical protein